MVKPEKRVLDYLKQYPKVAFTRLAFFTGIQYYHLQIILEKLRLDNKIEVETKGKWHYAKLKGRKG